ncbi:type I phosphomannose isomerase catalytic subunit [Flavobacterium sp.]|uniref:type I phosphomannose isomerase catalytic subunit n=1 Tax=Flavobacterium sp. TaxID=239 RepID=UPI003527CDD1
MEFYPLQFTPILKDRIWGGTKLKSLLNKEIPSETTGESWELSTVPNEVSVINNGEFKGKNLNEIINLYPIEILGESVISRFGKEFPLLFKFIDAKTDLSIQVHPNDELAKKRHNSFGKTEMWYVMQADENARLVVGFKQNATKNEYVEKLNSKQLAELLNEIPVAQGDIFFLETGTVHAIGGGVVVAEIQQTSDITYRLYDWDRVDANGIGRELHTELALDAINYNTTETKIAYNKQENKSNIAVHCNYFKTNVIPLNGKMNWIAHNNSFTVFMCTEGSFSIEIDTILYQYKMGDTVLLPAIIQNATILGKATILEVWV